MSTYQGKDDCTDTILNMISEHESHGNYNAVIGFINGYKGIDLSTQSIKDIYGLMDTLLYKEHMPSTAIGRYQIIRRTMKNLVSILNLSLDTKFTPELQDRLAVELLKIRGYQKWWLGKLGNIGFAHKLSCEWASLPDPYNGGRSHYQGVGNNRAGMPLAYVYAMLDKAKTLRPHGN